MTQIEHPGQDCRLVWNPIPTLIVMCGCCSAVGILLPRLSLLIRRRAKPDIRPKSLCSLADGLLAAAHRHPGLARQPMFAAAERIGRAASR